MFRLGSGSGGCERRSPPRSTRSGRISPPWVFDRPSSHSGLRCECGCPHVASNEVSGGQRVASAPVSCARACQSSTYSRLTYRPRYRRARTSVQQRVVEQCGEPTPRHAGAAPAGSMPLRRPDMSTRRYHMENPRSARSRVAGGGVRGKAAVALGRSEPVHEPGCQLDGVLDCEAHATFRDLPVNTSRRLADPG